MDVPRFDMLEISRNIYNALGPKAPGADIVSPGEDFRVGVAAAYAPNLSGELKTLIINRGE